MKIKKLLFTLIIFFTFLFNVNAKNNIYSIDMDIYIDKDGNASVTETWNVKGINGTEWYKGYANLGSSNISNFTVSMDNKRLIYKKWNINESLEDKKGYYGINYTSNGLELCFGKYDYEKHTFVLKYDISNFIFKTTDSDVLYFSLIDKFSNVDFNKFNVNVTSYYTFPDTLDVWAYGYNGYAYVKDGKITMFNENNSDMNNKYVVLLVKFPLNTFNISTTYSKFNTFNDVYLLAEKDNDKTIENIIFIIEIIIVLLVYIYAIYEIIKYINSKNYGYKDNKIINKKNTPLFREIPCNKDIYYANTLIKLNNFKYKEANILGAILLKWVKEDKISFITKTSNNKKVNVIDLTKKPTFSIDMEENLFNMMYKASKDGYLEKNEFNKWAKRNYNKFFKLFNRIEKDKEKELINKGYIYKRKYRKECKKKNVLNDKIYNDSKELFGLKLYLEEFSSINTKEVMDVKIWDEYLMFAYLFGIAGKVVKKLKNMYPELINKNNSYYDTIILVNRFSGSAIRNATKIRSTLKSFTSGGSGAFGGGGGGGSR